MSVHPLPTLRPIYHACTIAMDRVQPSWSCVRGIVQRDADVSFGMVWNETLFSKLGLDGGSTYHREQYIQCVVWERL